MNSAPEVKAYKAICQGGTGGKCTDPDCEKCWPDNPAKDDLSIKALTLEGALLIADSAVHDSGDLQRIALKTLAHEYRKLRLRNDRLQQRIATLHKSVHT